MIDLFTAVQLCAAVFYTLHKLFCKVCAIMCPQAHIVCYQRTIMELVLTNYEFLLYFGGELIAISNALKYTENIDFFGCLSVSGNASRYWNTGSTRRKERHRT